METEGNLETAVAVIINTDPAEIESESENPLTGKLEEMNTTGNKLKSAYRQKYKRSWEFDDELRDWLSPFIGDQYSAYCRVCHCKLHAHKKGLLSHAKSSKHRKQIINPQNPTNGVVQEVADTPTTKKIKKAHFNQQWLENPLFSSWIRKIPNNSTKALCIACRSVITAGRSELIKHSQAAKHKKAVLEGFSETIPLEFEWFEPAFNSTTANNSSLNCTVVTYSNQNSSSNQANNSTPNSSVMPIADTSGLTLQEIISHLEDMAPLHLAEKWDNVGLLVNPTNPNKIHNILLTNDLTEKVMEEALKKKINLIISYHPPIFAPLKKLTQNSWKERIILTCIENRIAVYSPHTALDAIKGGVNDWLLAAYGELQSSPIQQSYADTNSSGHFSNCLDVLVSEGEEVTQALSGLENVILTVKSNEYGGCDVRVCCDDRTLPKVVDILSQHPVAQLCSRITKLQTPPLPGTGMGRIGTLVEPLPLYEIIHRTKQHIDQTHVRLALSSKHTRDTKVQTIAVCAGSGTEVLKSVKADVYVTGEMSHHSVLDANHNGSTVILCEHTNTERGYLKNWSEELRSVLGPQAVNVLVSEIDKDPLKVV